MTPSAPRSRYASGRCPPRSGTPAPPWRDAAKQLGVAVGGPLAAIITAATATGDHDVVREHLDLPVPPEMVRTRYGLHYLHARGRYRLAIGQSQIALRDFERRGGMATEWKLDMPELIPWRLDAAETLLSLDRRWTCRAAGTSTS
jgi:hypothetical protein